ncbi:MAG: hypothetical protein ACI9WC_001396 [Arenicella sp.]|jgi:hypothetical protein
MIGLFYVQDERYVTDAGKRWSDDVQDERYVTDAWTRRSDDVQDERSTTAPALWTVPPSMAVVCDGRRDLGVPCGVLTVQDRINN